MTEAVILDAQRFRWQRARGPLRLTSTQGESFATGGLGRFVSELSVRLLVLPADPQAVLLDFDEVCWKWWLPDRRDPVTGQMAMWGLTQRATVDAALRIYSYNPGQSDWHRHIALYRHGGMEMALGRDGGRQWGERRGFYLIPIVAKVWAALHLYAEVVAHLNVAGPWEITLGLRQTGNAALGAYGEGCAEPSSTYYGEPSCPEPNLLLRRELTDWPVEDSAIEKLALGLGQQVCDAWGLQLPPPYLAARGPLQGKFDHTKTQWS